MPTEQIDTLVVGAGQAGVALSEHLTRSGVSHIVLEKDRIAERWRTGRWDSLAANGPAWHDRFPNMEFPVTGPDGFAPKDEVATYFETYAQRFNAPIRCGVAVTRVTRLSGRAGFLVETSAGLMEAQRVVAATGPFQRPVIPALIPEREGLQQLHSSAYYNPAQLADGAVLVVGSGSSGVQIAEEIALAGRRVYLSVGPHDRPPRSYRGRDFVWWLGVLGKWDAAPKARGTEHVTIAVSGARGGETIDFRNLAAKGITLVGRTEACTDGVLRFASDLAATIARGDANYLTLLDEADAYVARNGLDLPEQPDARRFLPDPDCVRDPLRQLDLAAAEVGTVIWATGYALDFSWLQVDAFDEAGLPMHQRGVAPERGIYFLGLPWLSGRGSSFIWGVWQDARHIAEHIVIQRSYLDYQPQVARDLLVTDSLPGKTT
ncbi:flavin-containing monooxygenase [Acidisoma cladoniae]|jgi:putative flavoprotein involved in K+ transport|uniref:flavin-containing monooxygenase n=1 Tax=Acidisoma cladoniae TaxID=3040935 RepID=UPI00254E9069|nr:NAD(P)/FAD-dependent oxidoreductase [Acidisoma sp. PAMC 29798]